MPYTNTGRMNVTPFTGGGNAQNPADVIFVDSAPPPSGADVLAGTIAIIQSTGSTYICSKVSGSTATWVLLGGSSSDVNTLTGDSGGAISPTAGNITLTGGTGVVTSGSGSTITFNVVGGGIETTVVSGTSQAAAINNRYVPNNVALCTVTLPATAAVGSMVIVDGLGSGGWAIAQNAGQVINSPAGSTTIGVGGSLASTNRYDSVTLLCVVADTTWKIESLVGSLTIV